MRIEDLLNSLEGETREFLGDICVTESNSALAISVSNAEGGAREEIAAFHARASRPSFS